MEILGSNGGASSASRPMTEPDSSLLLPESSVEGMDRSMDSLPLNEKSFISDISGSIVVAKSKDEKRNKKTSVRSKTRKE
jgi:hypothetical protein